MFGKRCTKCNKRANSSASFCPNCGGKMQGNNSKEDSRNYGLLGKNDAIENKTIPIKPNNFFMEKFLDSAMKEIPSMIKMIEEQIENSMQEGNKNNENKRKTENNLHIKFFVNGKRVYPSNNVIRVKKAQEFKKIDTHFSPEQLKKIPKLKREEPASSVRRLSNKIIYELEVPGVKSKKDIQINQLENSIEIKAIAKDKYYTKNIILNLPLIDYFLEKDNLVVEFSLI